MINSELNRGSNMDQVSEARLWKALDDITDRLSNIECKLSEIVRLEEKVSSHHETLKRYGDRIDKHDERIRKMETYQAQNTGSSGTSGKVIAWVSALVSAIITGVIMITTSTFMKGS